MGVSDKLKRALGGEGSQEQDDGVGILTQVYDSSTLSWSTRIKGFIACFVLGIVCSIIGSVFIFFNNFIAFAILYTLGTICSLASTMFLMGPVKQLKKMMDPTRLICTLVLLACIVMTLVSALVLKIGGLVLLFVILQFLALTWYSLSYIPFASEHGIAHLIRHAWRESFPAFIACCFFLVYFSNSILVHYAPLMTNFIQLLAMTTNQLDGLDTPRPSHEML